MNGQIYKIFSDFYYVKTDYGTVECKLRDILKKKSEDVIVGDFVELDSVTADKKQAFISKILPRKNFLTRPKVSNISQAIIVSALKNPDIDYEQLNRYIALCEYHKIKPVLCFNKIDLITDKNIFVEIENIYKNLGYEVFFISALSKNGIDILTTILQNNTSILCGGSGAGKTSIINNLSKGSLNLETKSVSEKTKRGVHTTRHCEIYQINENISIVDTPGFSNIKFSFLMPKDVEKLFPEIERLNNCKYKDCLHICETDCNIINNLDLISPSRYKSYLKFVEEAKEYKKKIQNQGFKEESSFKLNKGIEIVKISERKRIISRKNTNQNIAKNGKNDE